MKGEGSPSARGYTGRTCWLMLVACGKHTIRYPMAPPRWICPHQLITKISTCFSGCSKRLDSRSRWATRLGLGRFTSRARNSGALFEEGSGFVELTTHYPKDMVPKVCF